MTVSTTASTTASTPDLPAPHSWLRPVRIAFVEGRSTPLLSEVIRRLSHQFVADGHSVQERPDDTTDLIVGTTPFGRPVSWRESLMFTGRARFRLSRQPAVWAVAHATPAAFEEHLERLSRALAEPEASPPCFDFPGLAPNAYRVLYEQGRRGGPLLALERLVQAQARTIRVILIVGEAEPDVAYHFDLVGAHPRSEGGAAGHIYEDIVRRIVTTFCSDQTVQHRQLPDPVPAALWSGLSTPAAMVTASEEFGRRGLFTSPVHIADLITVPQLSNVIASQYSEGCFGTWEPRLDGLVVTITGSARPLDKGRVKETDLALVAGVLPDGSGALARPIAGRPYEPPSSESVEMIELDRPFPRVRPTDGSDGPPVPLLRSKVHAHRGVRAFNRDRVIYAPLEPTYQRYLVSCATRAQALAVVAAFARVPGLRDPGDPRRVAFTILPGHGLLIAERWVAGTNPFETIWQLLDQGDLEIDSRVPQGPLWYEPGRGSQMRLRVAESGETPPDGVGLG